MDKATKYYKRALTKYHNGYIDEAINLCSASISKNNKYKAAASLKGVLFYFKGDLETARELWDFNVRVNKDVVSKKYLENTRFDDTLISTYAKSVSLINEVKIADALALLKECETSAFNVINVSNQIAVCLIKQGEFSKAKVYLDKVINIDKKNKMATDNIKMLKSYGIIDSKLAYVPLIIFLVMVLILGSGLSLHFANSRKVVKAPKVEVAKAPEKSQVPTQPAEKSQVVTPTTDKSQVITPPADKSQVTTPKEEVKLEEVKPKATPVEIFPYDKIKTYINEEDYDEVDKQLNLWQDKDIDDNSKALLQKALNLMKDQGIEFFYRKAYKYSVSKDYKNAFDYYYKVYTYGRIDYLYENSLFYLASSKENLGSTSEATKYYEEYSNTFPKGSYEDTVLYSLVRLYSKSDINKAKIFAKRLSENFANSEYNNNYIKGILSN